MDKEKDMRDFNHVLNMIERKKISLSGVKKIDSFDKEQFIIDSVLGYIIVKGEDLELVKLDTKDGVVVIKGLINSINYVEDNKKKNKKDSSVISRLFK